MNILFKDIVLSFLLASVLSFNPGSMRQEEHSADVFGKTEIEYRGDIVKAEGNNADFKIGKYQGIASGLPDNVRYLEIIQIDENEQEANAWIHSFFEEDAPFLACTFLAFDEFFHQVESYSAEIQIKNLGPMKIILLDSQGIQSMSSESNAAVIENGVSLVLTNQETDTGINSVPSGYSENWNIYLFLTTAASAIMGLILIRKTRSV